MLKPKSLVLCVATALFVSVMGGCGGGGSDDAQVPDPATQGGRVVEPQIPIKKAALSAGIRKLPPIPKALQADYGGLNASLHLLMHNPAWMKKFLSAEVERQFLLVPEYLALSHFVNAFRNDYPLESPHARLLKSYSEDSADDKRKGALIAKLNLEPIPSSQITERLTYDQTIFHISDEAPVRFDQLPSIARIIGITTFDGEKHVAYLKKGENWFGTNDEEFTQVNFDYVKQLGEGSKQTIRFVSYSAA